MGAVRSRRLKCDEAEAMNLLPRGIRRFLPSHPDFGVGSRLIRLDDLNVFVRPLSRVQCRARVLASHRPQKKTLIACDGRLSVDAVNGHDLAGLDVFLGHGWLTCDPVYFFHPARTTSTIHYIAEKVGDNVIHWRSAFWDGMGDTDRPTHVHYLTAHKERLPAIHDGDIIDIDVFCVTAFLHLDDGQFEQIACGSDRFCERQCPWIVDAADLITFDRARVCG